MHTEFNEIPSNIDIEYFENIRPILDNKFNILYLNARSLRNKFDEFTSLIHTTSIEIKKQIHAIVVTENWLFDSEIQLFNINGYNAFHCNRNGRRGGGVSIYIHDQVVACEIAKDFINDNNYLQINLPNFNFNILGIYRSHASSVASVTDYFDNENTTLTNTIFIGDLNINLNDLEDQNVQAYKTLVNSNGLFFINSPEFPTRISNTVQTFIDHIATSMTERKYELSYLDTSLSDHKMLLLTFNIKNSFSIKNIIQNRINYKKIDENNLLEEPCQANNLDTFVRSLSKIISENTQKITLSNKNTCRKEYISNDILILIRKREKNYKFMKKYPDNLFFKLRFKTLRNLVKYKIRDSKKKFYEAKFKENISDSKKTWKTVNELLKGTSKKSETYTIEIDGTKINHETQIADSFNEYFSKIGLKIQNEMDTIPTTGNFKSSLTYSGIHLANFSPTTEEQVLKIIDELKPNVAVGYDGISAKFLKKFSTKLAPRLTSLINICLQIGHFPDTLKKARITPVYKSGSKSNMSNYRPISILPAISKIFETLILHQLLVHLNSINFFHKHQYGFLPASSTLSATINLMNYILKNIDNKRKVGCLFIDLQKAFDCVDQKILIEKLHAAGLTGNALKIFISYFTSRKQCVKINNSISNEQNILTGIAQGSILGATLFLIFINDIFNLKLCGDIQLYADDAVVMYSANTHFTILQQMKQDADVLNRWFSINRIKMNFTKSNFILFGSEERNLAHISIEREKISEVKSIKYLGLIIDHKLKWTDHIALVRKKILAMYIALCKSRNFITEKIAWQIYNSHIYSHLTYLNPIWSSAADIRITILRTLQNKSIKKIKKFHWRHPTRDLYSAHCLPLDAIREYNLLLTIYKIKNQMLKSCAIFEQISDIHEHSTRSSANANFYVNHARTNLGQNNIFFIGLVKFNQLPLEIKNSNSISLFKKHISEIAFLNHRQRQIGWN
jgi:Reverse transcriptase (RNA-dependent DNA polymerase)